MIKAEFRLAKKWIDTIPTVWAELKLAKDKLKSAKDKMILRKTQSDKAQKILQKAVAGAQPLPSAIAIVTQELEHNAPSLKIQKNANIILTKCTPAD